MHTSHYQTIEVSKNNHCLSITLNRPSRRNAINDQMIYELSSAFQAAAQDNTLRVICLQAHGESFCAGADIAWMQGMAERTEEQNHADAQTLANLLALIFNTRIPVIAAVKGHVYGGGVGLLATCDTVIMADNTKLCLSEVKIGLIPATIYPYLIHTIGNSRTTDLSLSARLFSATQAAEYGLAHCICSPTALAEETHLQAQMISDNSPAACRRAKALLREITPIAPKIREKTSQALAEIRTSPEGQEGLHAFLEKRQPSWANKETHD